ncbi:hypothetical protein F4781DRAFT_385262 [Annulohypoxylon bovei var. microspora]|nr:hypothetical protein F4781DRAFT_385262 [Annulohypoxylon bovei var. microspora]
MSKSSDSPDELTGKVKGKVKGKGKATANVPDVAEVPDATGLAGLRKNYDSSVHQVHLRLELLASNQAKVNEDLSKNMNNQFEHVFNLITNLAATIATTKTTQPPQHHTDEDPASDQDQAGPSSPSLHDPDELPDTRHTKWHDPDLQSFPYSKQPKNRTSGERFSDGKLNLQRTNILNEAQTNQEGKVKQIWPEAVLPTEAYGFPKCEEKNKVVIPSSLKLIWADHTVLDKLSEIQNRLKVALVPYSLWTTRISTELSGDFQQVAVYVRTWKPTWVTFLEAVFQVLEEHHVLHSPLTVFTTLLPQQNESLVNFMRRMREAFYRLPVRTRDSHQNREILINLLRTYAPSVWLSLHDQIGPLNTAQAVEEAVRRAALITQTSVESKIYSTPATTIALHGTTAPFYNLRISEATTTQPGVAQLEPQDSTKTVPMAAQQATISDPRQDDRQVSSTREESGFAARASDNECFNCNKKGHWAKDCTQKPRFPRKTSTYSAKSEKVTLKGTLFRENNNDRQKFGKKVRNVYDKWKNKGDNKRVHFAEDEDEEQDQQSPAEALAESDIDLELADLFDSLGNED